jgi:hypothetical protein
MRNRLMHRAAAAGSYLNKCKILNTLAARGQEEPNFNSESYLQKNNIGEPVSCIVHSVSTDV